MTDIQMLIEITKIIGFPALIFGIWFFYHKSSTMQLNKIIDMQAERERANFNLLKDMIDKMDLQSGLLQKLVERVNSNQFCPYVRDLQQGRAK